MEKKARRAVNYIYNMPTLAENKKALFDYEILEKYEAGVALYGFEAKSVMRGSAQLKGAFVLIRGGEAHLINAVIPPYQAKNTPAWYEPGRPRKLLLHKKEIAELAGATSQKSLTLIPISLYTINRKIKLGFALARSRKKFEKRELIKKRDFQRERARIIRG